MLKQLSSQKAHTRQKATRGRRPRPGGAQRAGGMLCVTRIAYMKHDARRETESRDWRVYIFYSDGQRTETVEVGVTLDRERVRTQSPVRSALGSVQGGHTISFLESAKKADRFDRLAEVGLCLLLSICSSSCCSWLARTLGPATFG